MPAALRSVCLVGALAVGPLAVTVGLQVGPDPAELRAAQPLTHREDDYVGAAACAPCHPDHHSSWRRTWHATMNQRPTADAVVGAFDGRTVSFYGRSARVTTRGSGAGATFHMELPTASGETRQAQVALAVGSHIYQQYFEWRAAPDPAQHERVLTRLPLLWHIQERRWLHINGVFLTPDQPSWTDEPAIWNENCIFCHTTGPRPGMQNYVRPETEPKRFDSKTADLGISCESCHGPGARHVAAMRSPAARYGSYLGGAAGLHIVDPKKLDKEAAVSACGQCHGQRTPNPPARLRRFLETGPTFRPGDRLEDHVTPIHAQTVIGGVPMALRFWADGTPRLTAYEYQGVVASPCHQKGPMTCESCHTMHGFDADGGDRRGYLAPGMRGDRACLQCHESIARDVRAHTRHDPAGSGSRCMACHMPHMVYGVLGIHRSHRIENPDPARDAAAGRPNACTLCHLTGSPQWAGQQMRKLFGPRYAVPTRRANGLPVELPDALASVLSGDAMQRAVFAHALGRADAAPGDPVDGWLALIATLGDAYASVRTFAWRSLKARAAADGLDLGPGFAAFDPASVDPPQKQALVRGLLQEFAGRAAGVLPAAPATGRRYLVQDGRGLAPDLRTLIRLLDLQSLKVIDIGE